MIGDEMDLYSEDERRSTGRYPIEQSAVLRCHGAGQEVTARATTVNLSSRGALLATNLHQLPGAALFAEIAWPASLASGRPVKLVAHCRVVRRETAALAVFFESAELVAARPKEFVQ